MKKKLRKERLRQVEIEHISTEVVITNRPFIEGIALRIVESNLAKWADFYRVEFDRINSKVDAQIEAFVSDPRFVTERIEPLIRKYLKENQNGSSS
jgi:hypothetical protein